MKTLKTRLIASVTAIAIALGAAAPASAMTDSDRNALALILGAVALGTILNQQDKGGVRTPAPVTRHPNDYWYGQKPNWNGNGRVPVIPAQCTFPVRGASGTKEVVTEKCLREFGMRTALPGQCAFSIRNRNVTRQVFGVGCLMDRGFRVARLR